MAEFDTSHVKNIVLLGHAGSGKTSLAECMLFEAGIINRRGSVMEKILLLIIMNWSRSGATPSSPNYCIQNGGVTRLILLIHRAMMTL